MTEMMGLNTGGDTPGQIPEETHTPGQLMAGFISAMILLLTVTVECSHESLLQCA